VTVLVIAAHPDDECFMGATIARYVREGNAVYVGVLADGVSSRGNALPAQSEKNRWNAHWAACKALGATCLPAAMLTDQRLEQYAPQARQSVAAWVSIASPDVVYVHDPGDRNRDHTEAYLAALPAIRVKHGVKAVYTYAVRQAEMVPEFSPNVFRVVSLADQCAQAAALACYGDECRDDLPLIQALQQLYGSRAGVPTAEGFALVQEIC
jgi:LmbE family N-acetylglucosaminyl deacetylase